MPTTLYINHEVLRSLRERRGLSFSETAEILGVRPQVLLEWESGFSQPTLHQAQEIAKQFNIPLGYLFLSQLPAEGLPIPDLRRFPREPTSRPSPELVDLVNDVLLKQGWYREYLETQEAEPRPFVGEYSSKSSVLAVATDISTTIGIDDSLRRRAQSWEEYLRFFVQRVEAAGILVMRSSIVYNNTHRHLDLNEFRGFAISDEMAPLVFINTRDSLAGRIFTLAHELAHIWIGSSGIDDTEITRLPDAQGNNVELFCNHVAAEILVPSNDYSSRWSEAESWDRNVERLAAYYRVSRLVTLRKGYDLKKIPYEQYQNAYGVYAARLANEEDENPGGEFYTNLLVRNGRPLTRAVLAALDSGELSYRDAARLLRVKVSHLQHLAGMAINQGLASSD